MTDRFRDRPHRISFVGDGVGHRGRFGLLKSERNSRSALDELRGTLPHLD